MRLLSLYRSLVQLDSFAYSMMSFLTFLVAIFCTEPFRIPFAGRVDVCCFDKTGTITAENLVLEGVVGVRYAHRTSPLFYYSLLYSSVGKDQKNLIHVKDTSRETTLCLAAAHALVKLDDDTIVGDPMEKTTLEALEWTLGKGAVVYRCYQRFDAHRP